MEFPLEITVFLLSLTVPVILYTINHVAFLQQTEVIAAFGVVLVTSVVLLLKLSVRSRKHTDPLVYMFAVFSFSSMFSFINALQQDGLITGFVDFYVHKAEPYLSSAHGIMISYWDGVVHYVLLLLIIHHVRAGKSFRGLALMWAGSMTAIQVVLIPGIIIGKYGKNLNLGFWRNILLLAASVWMAVRLFNKPRELSISAKDKVQQEQKRVLPTRPVDLLLALTLLAHIAFTLFRGFVVLDCSLDSCFTYIYQYEPYMKDSVGFPKITMLVLFFYALPLFTAALYGLSVPGCSWMLDWMLFLAGAVAQIEWTHTGASLHSRTPFTYRIPKDEWHVVLVLNVLYGVVPVLLALRCWLDPSFFQHPPVGHTGRKQQ